MKKETVKYVVILIALVVVIALIVAFLLYKQNKIDQTQKGNLTVQVETESMEHQLIVEEEKISGENVSSEIKDLGELITADYYYTHAETYDSSKQIWGITLPMTSTGFVYMVDGDIKAGIDFTAVKVQLDHDAKKVSIQIPKAKVLASEIDHESFRIVSQKNSIFNDLEASDVNDTFDDVKKSEEARAIETGLLTRAEDNAKRILDSFVKNSFGLQDYTIEITVEG